MIRLILVAIIVTMLLVAYGSYLGIIAYRVMRMIYLYFWRDE